tara:strand:- start:1126 stop:1356 length:231 start_codon:yes stop_codon:yes gene_type:complete
MKALIEKQILQWKEELAKQVQTKNQAEKVLAEANKTILMIEGGIQAKEMLLKKIEQESQLKDTKELKQQSEPAQSD